jgi:hypothetical protein
VEEGEAMTNEPDKSGRVRRAVAAALILFALLLGACAKRLTTDERLVMIAPLSPTPTPAVTQPQTITGNVIGVSVGDTITVLDGQKRQREFRFERKIYHLPNCPDYNKVSEKNRVPFASEADAVKAGYKKARNCP